MYSGRVVAFAFKDSAEDLLRRNTCIPQAEWDRVLSAYLAHQVLRPVHSPESSLCRSVFIRGERNFRVLMRMNSPGGGTPPLQLFRRTRVGVGFYFAPLLFNNAAQLALHRFESVVDHFVERFVCAVVHLSFVSH